MQLIERSKKFMNTDIIFKVVRDTEPTVKILDLIEEGFYQFDRIVKSYTRFDENSELSNLNRMNGSDVRVSKEFFLLVEYMISLANKTKGAFDPTVIDYLEVYGYDKNYDFTKLDQPELNQYVENIFRTRKSYKEIKLNKKDLTIKLAKGQRIDLGGVGKGYAIDCAYKVFKDGGIKNFLINAGGDMRASGKNKNKEFWKVELIHENEKGEKIAVGMVELKNEALACSGSWARKVKQFHHLINIKTGKPVENKKTIFVKAKTAMVADSWATALFVSNISEIEKNIPKNISFHLL